MPFAERLRAGTGYDAAAIADLPETARVAFIGGGDTGASCLRHLARAGRTDCLLLEKNQLTAGLTWQAAGNAPTFPASWSVMNMQHDSADSIAASPRRSTTR